MNYTTGVNLWEGAQPGILKAGEVHRKSMVKYPRWESFSRNDGKDCKFNKNIFLGRRVFLLASPLVARLVRYTLVYKQHFYKQRQAEHGKKLSKC